MKIKFFNTRMLFALLATCIILSCNPAKRLAKQQQQFQSMLAEYILLHPPIVDTVTKVLPGKIDTVPVPVPVMDYGRLKKSLDSLRVVLKGRYIADSQDCERQINEAFETGRQAAIFEFSQQKIIRPRPDTVYRKTSNVDYENALKLKLQQSELARMAAEGKRSYFLEFIVSLIANILLILLIIKTKF